jgi:hypothetical protein
MNKRQLIKQCASVLCGGFTAIAASHLSGGIRFPFVQGESTAKPITLDLIDPKAQISLEGAFIQTAVRTNLGLKLVVRAFAPEPIVLIQTENDFHLELVIKNISADAMLQTDFSGDLSETQETTINRILKCKTGTGRISLVWTVPFTKEYRFTAIGDSGAGTELNWCLHRSVELKANFVLHLGDVFYDDDDIQKFEGNLDRSPLPIYISIGNHDFQKSGRNLHPLFTNLAGPMNSLFQIGNTSFVNFDTSASTWPSSSGNRAKIFDLAQSVKSQTNQWVFMTHRPFHDTREYITEDEKHILSAREHEYVMRRMLSLDSSPTLLAGHIHDSIDVFQDNIQTYIAGDGLGVRNMVTGKNVSKILVGEQELTKKIKFSWESLNLPKELHCHSKAVNTRRLLNERAANNNYGESCSMVKKSSS